MKSRQKVGVLFLASILLISLIGLIVTRSRTGPPVPEAQETHSGPELGWEYRPPVFVEDNRAESIRSLAADFHEAFEENARRKHIPGVAYGVVVDGELVLDSALGFLDATQTLPATPASSFRIASMTKSFTAMAILKLRDEGLLSLEDLAVSHIPELEGTAALTRDAAPIRIRQLLTMSAGFPEDNPWGDRQLDESREMLSQMATSGIRPSTSVATSYEYSNTGYALLGEIISRVSGMPYQQYISSEILLPLGMEHTVWEYDKVPENELAQGYRWEDKKYSPEPILHDGSFGAMGGLITTLEDFSKYVSFHLQAWPPRDDPLEGPLSRSSLREMHMPRLPRLVPWTDPKGNPCAVIVAYGYGLRVEEDCLGIREVSHGGALPGYGSKYYFYPDHGVGVMAFGNLTYTGPLPYEAIREILFEKAELQARKLPPSSILQKRKEELTDLLLAWAAEVSDLEELEEDVLAENFYLDLDREHRIKEAIRLFDKLGDVDEVTGIEAENQLRGTFHIHGSQGSMEVFFTLSPESSPRVQQLDLNYVGKQSH